jgi:uncharacterized protein (DUF697 family)
MNTTIEATVVEETQTPQQPVDHLEAAEALVRKNVYISAGIGILPVPFLDLAALTGIQLNMLYQLSKMYGIPFNKEATKSIIGSLASGSGTAILARPAYSLLKAIPVVGWTIGGLTLSIVGGASTYALGKVFIQHFESGGTFLTFDPKAVRAHYTQLQEEGRKVAAEAAAAAAATAAANK